MQDLLLFFKDPEAGTVFRVQAAWIPFKILVLFSLFV